MDDATIGEAVFRKTVTHDGVITMRVDADIAIHGEAPLKQVPHNSVAAGQARHPVDDVVSPPVEPSAIVDDGVCRLWPSYKGPGGDGLAVLQEQIAVTVGNVVLNLFFRGVVGIPLMRVAGSDHDLTAAVNEVHNSLCVMLRRPPDDTILLHIPM